MSLKAPMMNILNLLQHPAAPSGDILMYYPTEQEFIIKMTSLQPAQQKALFPENIFVVYKKPLKILASNMKKVYKIGRVFWSGALRDGAVDDRYGPMMSCVQVHPCQAGVRLDQYIYGETMASVQAHVFHALLYLRESFPFYRGSIEYVLYYPLKVELHEGDIFASHIKWQPGCYKDLNKYVAVRYFLKKSNL